MQKAKHLEQSEVTPEDTASALSERSCLLKRKWDQQDPKEPKCGGERNSVLNRLSLNPVNSPGKGDETLGGTDLRFRQRLEV